MHGDGKEQISQSVAFLPRYEIEIRCTLSDAENERRKGPVERQKQKSGEPWNRESSRWVAPSVGTVN